MDELGSRICELGFVVHEATASTIPFLIELAGAPHVTCRAEVLELLLSAFNGRQWSAAVQAAPAKYSGNYREQVGWEAKTQHAVRAGQAVYRGLVTATDPQVAEVAAKLVRAVGEQAAEP
ncbi:hypothetical protein [Streptomyces sp. NPDC127119]|uniref:hypothetical protein n=1 Tax=Streptomyces sp. NPDC127119 TaxID=3345370 RepID=UPI003642447F